jgi:hypothetical protein
MLTCKKSVTLGTGATNTHDLTITGSVTRSPVRSALRMSTRLYQLAIAKSYHSARQHSLAT